MYKVRVLNPNNVRVEYVCMFNNNVRVDLLEEVCVKKICMYRIKRCVYMYLSVCVRVLLRRARVCFVCFHLLRHHHLHDVHTPKLRSRSHQINETCLLLLDHHQTHFLAFIL